MKIGRQPHSKVCAVVPTPRINAELSEEPVEGPVAAGFFLAIVPSALYARGMCSVDLRGSGNLLPTPYENYAAVFDCDWSLQLLQSSSQTTVDTWVNPVDLTILFAVSFH